MTGSCRAFILYYNPPGVSGSAYHLLLGKDGVQGVVVARLPCYRGATYANAPLVVSLSFE